MTRQDILRQVDDLVELEPGTLTGGEKLEDLEGWNSMAMVSFIALADENGVKLSARQIASAETVDDLLKMANAPVA